MTDYIRLFKRYMVLSAMNLIEYRVSFYLRIVGFIFSVFFIGGAAYLFFRIKRKKMTDLGNFAPLVGALKQNNAPGSVKQSWDIFVDD